MIGIFLLKITLFKRLHNTRDTGNQRLKEGTENYDFSFSF